MNATERAAWLEWRRGGICGTDVAAIAGVGGDVEFGKLENLFGRLGRRGRRGLGAEPGGQCERRKGGGQRRANKRMLHGAVRVRVCGRRGMACASRCAGSRPVG